jgi:hypothetical protein
VRTEDRAEQRPPAPVGIVAATLGHLDDGERERARARPLARTLGGRARVLAREDEPADLAKSVDVVRGEAGQREAQQRVAEALLPGVALDMQPPEVEVLDEGAGGGTGVDAMVAPVVRGAREADAVAPCADEKILVVVDVQVCGLMDRGIGTAQCEAIAANTTGGHFVADSTATICSIKPALEPSRTPS